MPTIAISPKAMFQQQENLLSDFRKMAASNVLQSAVLYALGEMSVSYNLTAEQTTAVRDFAHELLNLGEPKADTPRFPTRTVSMSDPALNPKPKK